jgi:hypothetical protein
MNTFIYASCKDINGNREYLVGPSEDDIEVYCENGLLGHEKEILNYYTNPDPIMVCHHFTWVGTERRPPILCISKPHDYDDPFKVPIEKW